MSKFLLLLLLGTSALVWFVMAIVAIYHDHYDQASAYLLVTIVFTLWENQVQEARE